MVGALSILGTIFVFNKDICAPPEQSFASACYENRSGQEIFFYHGSTVFNNYCNCT